MVSRQEVQRKLADAEARLRELDAKAQEIELARKAQQERVAFCRELLGTREPQRTLEPQPAKRPRASKDQHAARVAAVVSALEKLGGTAKTAAIVEEAMTTLRAHDPDVSPRRLNEILVRAKDKLFANEEKGTWTLLSQGGST
jgi:hypothetical protein